MLSEVLIIQVWFRAERFEQEENHRLNFEHLPESCKNLTEEKRI